VTPATLMATTAFLPILIALDRLFVAHTRGLTARTRPCVTHVAFGTLVDYVRGLGSPAAREQVREHLSTCVHCEQTAGRLTRLAEIAAADADGEVPDEVVDEAIALFTSDAADRRALADVDRLSSRRSRRTGHDADPDNGRQAPPRFIRFAAPEGEIDVHLLVIEEREVVTVSGQIIAREADAPLDWEVSAHRASGADAIATTRATAAGLFQLRYDAPAAALLRLVNAAASQPVNLPIEG
jgi:anti-sigma factor RsiW